jgi:hypothetical protein
MIIANQRELYAKVFRFDGSQNIRSLHPIDMWESIISWIICGVALPLIFIGVFCELLRSACKALLNCACCNDDDDDDAELIALRSRISERRGQVREGRISFPSPNPSPDDDVEEATSTNEQIFRKFKFQTVILADKMSNINATSIRAEDLDSTSDDGSVINQGNTDSNSQSKRTIRNMLSTWRRPSQSDSCCICLEAYRPGDRICAATITFCDHAFHKECIFEWLQNDHNDCPLCRTDLMQS